MPRGRNATTLKQSCLNVIARNFERLWAQQFDKQFGDVPRLLHVIGPFHDVPGQLCQDILHRLQDLRLLRRCHLQLLLVPQVTEVSFAASSANSLTTQAVDLLALRCKNLVSLKLTNCMSLSSKALTHCLSTLPLLRTLILKQTKINDEVMKAIALHLSYLTHLDLHACPVTTQGAIWFCGDNGDFEPVCTELTQLDISATKIDLTGCSSIVQCYPKLRYLSYADSVEAVAILHKEKNVNKKAEAGSSQEASGSFTRRNENGKKSLLGPPELHKLEVLFATALQCRRIDPDSIQLACYHCPNVREMYWYQDATDKALRHLKQLQHLRVLEVTSDKPQSVTFHGGVLPLLQAQGPEMLSLGLYDVQDIDLGLLGALCPQLQRLKLVTMLAEADFSHSYLTSQQRAESFKALRQLTLVFGEVGEASPRLNSSDMEHLLVNAFCLQQLHLIEVHCLTDEVLIAALSVHGFPYLKEVQLEFCDHVTVVSMVQLLGTSSPLLRLSLKHCQLITYEDFQNLNTIINTEGLDLEIEWA